MTREATCAACGKTFTARRSDARYCSSNCRGVASVERKLAGVAAKVAPPPPPKAPSVSDSVRAELDRLGLVGSVAGTAALSLAARIDAQSESGAAMAAMVRELRATMAEASAGAVAELDVLDELRARREARRGA